MTTNGQFSDDIQTQKESLYPTATSVTSFEGRELPFHLLFEQSTDAMLVMKGPVIIECNPAAIQLLHCAHKEEVLSLHPADMLPLKQAEGSRKTYAHAQAQALAPTLFTTPIQTAHRCETTCYRPDTTTFPAEVVLTPISAPEGQLLSLTIRDISERKQREDMLRARKRDLATLMVNLPGMAYRGRNDRKRTMEFVSGGSLELTGYPPNGLMHNLETSYGQLISPDDRVEVWDTIQAALQTKHPYEMTYRIITDNGQEKWVWEKGRGVHCPDRERIELQGFVTDITRLKSAEQTIEDQAAALHELSTPILRISNHVILMPLIGSIDTFRAQQVMDTLLEGIFAIHAECAIIDITGIPAMDTHVASVLVEASTAARLLGAQVILTGIGPAMAQTLVGLGVNLQSMSTCSTLQRGIQEALQRSASAGIAR